MEIGVIVSVVGDASASRPSVEVVHVQCEKIR
jgi:hypothetical protein